MPRKTPIEGKYVEFPNAHWIWIAAFDTKGYGHLQWDGRVRTAHRVLYEEYVGPIPNKLDLDHLCRIRHCVNPAHMEPVTRQENLRRGIRPGHMMAQPLCRNGHVKPLGRGRCRICFNEYHRAWRKRGGSDGWRWG